VKFGQLIARLSVILPKLNLTKFKLELLTGDILEFIDNSGIFHILLS